MSVGIHETGQNDLVLAVDFNDGRAIFLQPGIVEGILGLTNRNNLSSDAKHRRVFNNSEVEHFWPSAWT